jgi:hypothetical protein
MKTILVFTKTNDTNEALRRDVHSILNHLSSNHRIHVYDIKKATLIDYTSKHNTSYAPYAARLFKRLYPVWNAIALIKLLLSSRNRYDAIQINYVRHEFLLLWPLLKWTRAKVFLLFYGSDFNQRDGIKNNFSGIFRIAHNINFTNPNLVDIFNRRYRNKFADKVHIIDLPFDHFKFYEHFTYESKNQSKTQLHIDPSKFVIAVGTNALANEQHEAIIAQLSKLDKPERFHLIFVLSHANTAAARSEMLQALIQRELSHFSMHVFTEFLSYEEVAQLRHASNCLLNFRKIDQMTLSMLESNLAYCSVITGSWLPYSYYYKFVKAHVLERINEMNGQIERLRMEEGSFEQIQELQRNHDSITNRFNLQAAFAQWDALHN